MKLALFLWYEILYMRKFSMYSNISVQFNEYHHSNDGLVNWSGLYMTTGQHFNLLQVTTACQIYFVECVSKIKHISQLSIIQYMGLCVFSLPISLVMIERIHFVLLVLSSSNWTGSMNYYPLFRVRSWNNGMRCMSLYILILGFLFSPVCVCVCMCRGGAHG